MSFIDSIKTNVKTFGEDVQNLRETRKVRKAHAVIAKAEQVEEKK